MSDRSSVDWAEVARLVAYRGARGLRTMARDTGVSIATLSRIERGKPCDVEIFAVLSRGRGWMPTRSWVFKSRGPCPSKTAGASQKCWIR